MKRLLIAVILGVALSAYAAAPPRGGEQLSALAVFPQLSTTVNWSLQCRNGEWVIDENPNVAKELARERDVVNRQPGNMDALMSLAYLLGSDDQTNESRADYKIAEQFYRKRVAESPKDALSLVALGKAIEQAEDSDEAESVFRRATLVSPGEWETWAALGSYLEDASLAALFSKDVRNLVVPAQPPPSAILAYRPTPAALEKAEALRVEADHCFDRASALAPEEPRLFIQLAGFKGFYNWENCYLRYYRDEATIAPNEWMLSFFSPAMADLKQAARLKPMNYQYTAMEAFLEYSIPLAQMADQPVGGKPSLNRLSDASRQSIHQAMARLQNIADAADAKDAAGALEMLAMLNMAMGNKQATLDASRRATKLDPTRDEAWDLLLLALTQTDSPDAGEITGICESRLKIRDSEPNHVLFSHELVKFKKWDDAAVQAQIAQQMDTNDVVPPLTLAAIALTHASQTNYLFAAGAELQQAQILLEKNSNRADSNERRRELYLNIAIFEIFINQPKVAATYAEAVLKYFPEDSVAPEILKYTVPN